MTDLDATRTFIKVILDLSENGYVSDHGDLLLRLATEALGVLDRHSTDNTEEPQRCPAPGCYERGERLPCPEVQTVIRAWTP